MNTTTNDDGKKQMIHTLLEIVRVSGKQAQYYGGDCKSLLLETGDNLIEATGMAVAAGESKTAENLNAQADALGIMVAGVEMLDMIASANSHSYLIGIRWLAAQCGCGECQMMAEELSKIIKEGTKPDKITGPRSTWEAQVEKLRPCDCAKCRKKRASESGEKTVQE